MSGRLSPELPGRSRVLDLEAPGLDEETRERRRALLALTQLPIDELFRAAVHAGIYTPMAN